jgi:S1-C subfamily serine protease
MSRTRRRPGRSAGCLSADRVGWFQPGRIVVGRCGYRLQYAARPSGFLEYLEESRPRSKFVSARDSLGLTFGEDGKVQSVVPGMAGDKAGLAPGLQVIGVNGRKFSRQRLRDALISIPWEGLKLSAGDPAVPVVITGGSA